MAGSTKFTNPVRESVSPIREGKGDDDGVASGNASIGRRCCWGWGWCCPESEARLHRLPYTGIKERGRLAEELREVLTEVCDRYDSLDQPASVGSCREALADLCSKQEDRPQAFPMRTPQSTWWTAYTYTLLLLAGSVMATLLLVPSLALEIYAVPSPDGPGSACYSGSWWAPSYCVECGSHSSCAPGFYCSGGGLCVNCDRAFICDNDVDEANGDVDDISQRWWYSFFSQVFGAAYAGGTLSRSDLVDMGATGGINLNTDCQNFSIVLQADTRLSAYAAGCAGSTECCGPTFAAQCTDQATELNTICTADGSTPPPAHTAETNFNYRADAFKYWIWIYALVFAFIIHQVVDKRLRNATGLSRSRICVESLGKMRSPFLQLMLGSWIADRCATTPIEPSSDHKPLYLPSAGIDGINFGQKASVGTAEFESDPPEDPKVDDKPKGTVTRLMFLDAAIGLCVPFATAGQQNFPPVDDRRGDNESYPFNGIAPVRATFELVRLEEMALGKPAANALEEMANRSHFANSRAEAEEGRATVSLAAVALHLTKFDPVYIPKKIEDLAKYFKTPDDMPYEEFLILMICLSFEPDVSEADEELAMPSPATLVEHCFGERRTKTQPHQLRSFLHQAKDAFSKAESKPTKTEQVLSRIDSVLSRVHLPFSTSEPAFEDETPEPAFEDEEQLESAELPSADSSSSAKLEAILSVALESPVSVWLGIDNRNKVQVRQVRERILEYLKVPSEDANISEADMIDVMLQLYFEKHGSEEGSEERKKGLKTARCVQTAAAYFQADGGGLSDTADVYKLLDLAYGGSTLTSDESMRAIAKLNEINRKNAVAQATSSFVDERQAQADSSLRSFVSPVDNAVAKTDFSSWVLFFLSCEGDPLVSTTEVALASDRTEIDKEIWLRQVDTARGRTTSHSALLKSIEKELKEQKELMDKRVQDLEHHIDEKLLGNIDSDEQDQAEIGQPKKSHRCECIKHIVLVVVVLLLVSLELTFKGQIFLAPLYWAIFSWKISGSVPVYVAIFPLLWTTMVAVSYRQYKQLSRTDEARQGLARSRGRLSVFLLRGKRKKFAETKLDCEADATEVHRRVTRKRYKTESTGFRWEKGQFLTVVGLECLLVQSYLEVVRHATVLPEYVMNNPGASLAIISWMHVWSAFFAVISLMFGFQLRGIVSFTMVSLQAAIEHPVAPLVSLRHPKNVVGWCRMRDRRRIELQKVELVGSMLTIISVLVAVLCAAYVAALWLDSAALTPLYLTYSWFAVIGCLNSIFMLGCLCDANRHHLHLVRMLEQQMDALQHDATVRLSDDKDDEEGRQLRLATDAIRSDLKVYHEDPRSRFFYILHIPVERVLSVMVSLLSSLFVTFGYDVVSGWRTAEGADASGSGLDFDTSSPFKFQEH